MKPPGKWVIDQYTEKMEFGLQPGHVRAGAHKEETHCRMRLERALGAETRGDDIA